MSAWMFWGYADRKVELGEWTKEEAAKFIANIERIDLEQDEFDARMFERLKQLKEQSTTQN